VYRVAVWTAAALYLALLTAVSVLPSGAGPLGGWDKDISPTAQNLAHVPAYAALAALALLCLATRGRVTAWRVLLAAAACCAYGAATEWLQSVIPGRTGSVSDALMNVVGVAVGAVVMACLLGGGDGK